MKKLILRRIAACTLLLAILYSCSENFLETTPTGSANSVTLANEKGVNALLIGAYHALLGAGQQADGWFGTWAWAASVSNWVWGSVASDDGTKGSDITDQATIVPIEDYTVNSGNGYVSDKWNANYDGVARANDVLKLLAIAEGISAEKATQIKAQALFLRAWFHFELKRVFNNIPYITETTADPALVPNNVDAWPLIVADMKFAADNLPAKQTDPGRPTKYAAEAVLARIYLFQKDYTAAKPLLDDIINNGGYTLMPNFDDNYKIATRNNAESIFEIQYAVNDGTEESVNGGYGDCLNFPQNVDGLGTCCGFHTPTQNFVNAFKTDAGGLPLLDTYNNTNFKNDMGVKSNELFVQDTVQTVDPRLDFTVGRRGVPYLDWGIERGNDWIRDQGNAGPYVYKKNMFLKSEQSTYQTTTGWATGVNANNYRAYRLAHILLWRAEVAIEENDLVKATTLVNMLRTRAANKKVMGRCRTFILTGQTGLKVDNSKPAANYLIGDYPTFPDKAYALKAVQMEARLEFGMEGHRHFDLVRWGIADATINAYLTTDRLFRSLFGGVKPAVFTANKNEYWPIPQGQIDLQPGVLTQNPGY